MERPAAPGAGPLGVDGVTAVVERADAGDRRQRMDHRSGLLRQVQVVLQQGVLGAVAAAGHALAALDAPSTGWPDAPEVGVVHLHPGLAEEHTDWGGPEGVADTHLFGDLTHDLVGRCEAGVGDDPQHPLGLVVERGQLGPPIRDVSPLRVVVEGAERLVERVGVVEGPAADPGAGQHHHVLDDGDALDAEAPQPRGPEEGPDLP